MHTSNITAIITTINVNYIEKCLESVCKQLRDVIVVCDRNVPEMREIVSKYGCRLIYTPSLGQGKARLEGIKHVTTKYVHLIDDDDWICSNFYPKELADINFTCNVTTLTKDLFKYGRPTGAINISCHIVKTDIMEECLEKFKDIPNVCEDHLYYDFFSNYEVREFYGDIMRILIKGTNYPNTNVYYLKELITKEYNTNNERYNQTLNKYKEANQYAYSTMCE